MVLIHHSPGHGPKLRNEWVDPDLAATRFEVFAAEQRESWHRLSPSTADLRDGLMRNHVLPAWKGHRIGNIAHLDVQAWVNDLVRKGLAPSTIRQTYACFERVIRAAVVARLIPASPCQNIQLPRDESREMHFLTLQQVSLLATAIGPEYETLVYFAAYTGLRWGEAVGLKLRRVHLLRGEIEVAQQLAEVNGHFSFKQPKTRQSRRIIGLPAFLVDMVARHLDTRPDDSEALVFVGAREKPLRRSNFARRWWKPAIARVGLPADLTFYVVKRPSRPPVDPPPVRGRRRWKDVA